MQTLMLLGREHTAYGRLHHQSLTPSLAAAISVGRDARTPSALAKAEPNEDALVTNTDGQHVLMAVADAHFGAESSHHFIRALQGVLTLDDAVARLKQACLAVPETESETSLTVLVFDRTTGHGEGLFFGDSRGILLQADRAQWVFESNQRYLRAGDPEALDWAEPCRFQVPADGMIALFTDGVDECCYRRPARSIQPSHLVDLFQSCRGDARQFARRLCAKALNGVDGHPGGQDNIALVVATR
jgi:hypothetical protein